MPASPTFASLTPRQQQAMLALWRAHREHPNRGAAIDSAVGRGLRAKGLVRIGDGSGGTATELPHVLTTLGLVMMEREAEG